MTPQWTALFYTYAEDADTKAYAGELESLLLRIKHTEAFNLLLFRSQYFENSNKIHGELLLLRSSPDGEFRQPESLKYFPAINPGQSKLLSDVLATIIGKGLLQGKFLFFPWDHGTGFGIFNWNPFGLNGFAKTITPPKLTVIRSGRSKRKARGFELNQNIFALNAPGINMLTMAEINEALQQVSELTTVVIIMLNCWTQMLETGYEFSDTVEWLVAPETVHYFKGYDYQGILAAIADNPDISTAAIAEKAISSLYDYFNNDLRWRDGLKDLVVSAVQPSRSKDVVSALTDICQHHLEPPHPGTFQMIATVRNNCLDISSDGTTSVCKFIDLLHFFRSLKDKELIDPALYDRMHNAMKDYIQFIHTPETDGPTGPAYGCSLYHPNESIDFADNRYYNYFFVRDNFKMASVGDYSWANYLYKYNTGSPI